MKKKRILRDRPLITCSRVVLFTVGSEHSHIICRILLRQKIALYKFNHIDISDCHEYIHISSSRMLGGLLQRAVWIQLGGVMGLSADLHVLAPAWYKDGAQ